jgi:hypothetical protein
MSVGHPIPGADWQYHCGGPGMQKPPNGGQGAHEQIEPFG